MHTIMYYQDNRRIKMIPKPHDRICKKHNKKFVYLNDGEQEFFGCETCEDEDAKAFEEYLTHIGRRQYGAITS